MVGGYREIQKFHPPDERQSRHSMASRVHRIAAYARLEKLQWLEQVHAVDEPGLRQCRDEAQKVYRGGR